MSTLEIPPRLAERTPLDWRSLLVARLDEQAQRALAYEAYYDGEHPLQFATSKFREAFGNLFGAFADNWCQIVVDAPVERLRVIGFEVNGETSDDAWTIWQHNSLDVESVVAHTEAGKCGRAYLLVDPNDGDPRITVEHESQIVVAHDPGDRRRRLAALKRWRGDDGYLYATLYLPDAIFKFESDKPVGGEQWLSARFEWIGRDEVEYANPLGVVPVVPLENKPGLLGVPHSDLDPTIPLQNAINKLCSDMIVASEYGAFPQRAVTGVDVPKDPVTGEASPLVQLKASLSRLWAFKPGDARIWDLKSADLSIFTGAIEMFIQHLAAQTRTPPHYLLAKLINTSGDALQVAEAGLVAKCRTKALFFSDSWEEAIALALTASGTAVGQADCEAVWADPQRQSQAQLVDAAVKKETLSVPLETIWLELGYTPEQIEQWSSEQAATPTAPVTPQPTGPVPETAAVPTT